MNVSLAYTSTVKNKCKRIEVVLKLVCTEENLMEETFSALWPDGTTADMVHTHTYIHKYIHTNYIALRSLYGIPYIHSHTHTYMHTDNEDLFYSYTPM